MLAPKIFHRFHTLFLELKVVSTQGVHIVRICLFANCIAVQLLLNKRKQDAQLSQRDRAAGYVIVFAKSRRRELGDNIIQTL